VAGATAIGFGSIANQSNSVSFGVAAGTPGYPAGLYRTLQNVADGVQAHDAVTVEQLSAAVATGDSTARTASAAAQATANTANANATNALGVAQGMSTRLDALSSQVGDLSNRMSQAETGIASSMAMSSASSSATLAALRSARSMGLGMGAGTYAGRSATAMSFAASLPAATVTASVAFTGKAAAQIGAGWSV